MPSLFRKSLCKRSKKRKQKADVSKNGHTINSTPERYSLRPTGNSSFSLGGDDIVIVATKKSKKRMSGLELEKQDQCLVVKRILEGSPFAKTGLSPDMEIRIINGIDCSKLRDENEAQRIIGEAEHTVTIVARERLEDKDIPLLPISPPPKSSFGAAHMWVEMVQNVNRKDTPVLLSPPPKRQEFCLRQAEAQGEEIEAPPTPCFKKTSRPKTLPSSLDMGNRGSAHSAISEITLNPSEHPTPAADIVLSRPGFKKGKNGSIKSVLGAMYPDYDGMNDDSNRSFLRKSFTESFPTQDMSLTPISLPGGVSPSHLHEIEISLPPLDDDDDSSVGSFRGRARPMESHSLYPPSIPRVGACIISDDF